MRSNNVQTTQLGKHIRTRKGFAFKSKWYSEEGIPIVKVSDFTADSVDTNDLTLIPASIARDYQKYRLESGDVVIQTVGSWPSNPQSVVGKVIRIPRHASGALLNQNAVKVFPDEEIDKAYLFYLLRSDHFKSYIIGCAQGAASQASITLDAIREYTFPLLPRETQRRIAAILSAYDDLIENNTQRIRSLEAMAQALYREWFVHFRFPGHEDVPLVESALAPIPRGWEVGRLDDALILQRGFDLPTRDRIEGDIPVYAATGPVGTHNEAKVKGPGIVTGRSGSLGTVTYIDGDFWPLNTTLWVREFKHSTPLYAYYLLSDLQLEQYNSGAAVPTLNRNDIHGLQVILPSLEILESFDEVVLPVYDLMRIGRERNDVLREARDLLLPRLVSGEIDVSELEIDLGDLSDAGFD